MSYSAPFKVGDFIQRASMHNLTNLTRGHVYMVQSVTERNGSCYCTIDDDFGMTFKIAHATAHFWKLLQLDTNEDALQFLRED